MTLATFQAREMNKTEAAYSRELFNMQKVGLIKWYEYECVKFRLADKTWYTPDFLVVDAEDRLEAVEIKAHWQGVNRAGWLDDARVKVKVAAEMFPLKFRAAVLMPDGSWQFENFGDFEDPGAEWQAKLK
jgi:hypothetical protein